MSWIRRDDDNRIGIKSSVDFARAVLGFLGGQGPGDLKLMFSTDLGLTNTEWGDVIHVGSSGEPPAVAFDATHGGFYLCWTDRTNFLPILFVRNDPPGQNVWSFPVGAEVRGDTHRRHHPAREHCA